MTYQKLTQAKIKGLDIGVKVWGCTVLFMGKSGLRDYFLAVISKTFMLKESTEQLISKTNGFIYF